MDPNNQRKYKCDFRNCEGEICNIRCITPNRCSKHKTSESYTQQCTFDGCTKYTKSKHLRCPIHIRRVCYDKAPEQGQEQVQPKSINTNNTSVEEVEKTLSQCKIAEKPKLTPAERMKHARDAKAAKKTAVVNATEILQAQSKSEDSE